MRCTVGWGGEMAYGCVQKVTRRRRLCVMYMIYCNGPRCSVCSVAVAHFQARFIYDLAIDALRIPRRDRQCSALVSLWCL